ncbi:MAG: excinuclease ABC subunit UvrC [Dialister sp.]|nr:excinuclease ABC subunit UvrC [Dialister sp.]
MIDVNDTIRAKVESLPDSPGVYRWKDKNGRVIYVGKAKNLKNRVRSYVREDKNRSPKVAAMMRHAEDLDITMTATEMEALILECNLIKEMRPKYNISLRDDKSYPYVKITVHEPWPRIFVTRNIRHNDGAKYYGPFTDVGSLRQTLALIRRYYPIRTCRTMNVSRPCLQYHLGLCVAPCAGLCDSEAYARYVQGILDLFEGRGSELLRELKEKMEKAAEALDFEEAAHVRDQLWAVESVRQRQHIVSREGDFDVVGLARDGSHAGIEIFYIRYGRMVGKENFSIPESESETNEEIITAFIKAFYGGNPSSIPREVILPFRPLDASLLEKWLSDLKGGSLSFAIPERGFKRRLKDMAMANAAKYLSDKKLQWQYQDAREQGALQTLKELLHLPKLPERMECFDISHNQGAETTGSMVVFEHGRPAKREYRKFKLKTTQGKPDDFQSMAEVMSRRYGNEKEWPQPDLIVLDGGLGQMSAAIPVIRGAGCQAAVIGLAKRMEEIYVEGKVEPIVLDRHEPALQLLQFIRDEAHRFVISYHRKWASRRNTESVLDHIEGIGPARRKALWHAFRSLDEMRAATVEELVQVPGMNRRVAEKVHQFFHARADEKQMILQGVQAADTERET